MEKFNKAKKKKYTHIDVEKHEKQTENTNNLCQTFASFSF